MCAYFPEGPAKGLNVGVTLWYNRQKKSGDGLPEEAAAAARRVGVGR